MMFAKDFVGKIEGIYEIEYSGEPLYNVLLENHQTMKANNLTVETLDPENAFAKIFIDSYDPAERNKKVNLLLENLLES